MEINNKIIDDLMYLENEDLYSLYINKLNLEEDYKLKMLNALKYKNFEMIKDIWKKKLVYQKKVLNLAALNGRLDIIKKGLEKYNIFLTKNISTNIIYNASYNDHLDIIKYIFNKLEKSKSYFLINITSSFQIALQNKSFKVIDFLEKTINEKQNKYIKINLSEIIGYSCYIGYTDFIEKYGVFENRLTYFHYSILGGDVPLASWIIDFYKLNNDEIFEGCKTACNFAHENMIIHLCKFLNDDQLRLLSIMAKKLYDNCENTGLKNGYWWVISYLKIKGFN